MKSNPDMKQLMDIFVNSISTPSTSTRERYFLRETLHSLQRLTLSEQRLEMMTSVKKLIPASLRSRDLKRKGSAKYHEEHAAAQGKLSLGRPNP